MRGVRFTAQHKEVLRAIMKDAWGRKRGQAVPARRMRFNPGNPTHVKSYSYFKPSTGKMVKVAGYGKRLQGERNPSRKSANSVLPILVIGGIIWWACSNR